MHLRMVRWLGLAGILGCLCSCEGAVGAPPAHDSTGECSSANCPGCCYSGVCQLGTTPNMCGSGGIACVQCQSDQVCSSNGACVAGQCDPASCTGCCQGNACLPGTYDSACGIGGAPCVGCDPDRACLGGSCANSGACTAANCSGCCSGAECKQGTDNAYCGAGGAACTSCLASATCTEGTCKTTCTPDCTDKCTGEADGCGGACPSNTCSGCCSGNTCVTPPTITACGANGDACENCASQGKICGNDGSCTTPCTPSCAGACAGASDGCGGTCPTNACTGCCWGTNCVAPPNDANCGFNGVPCENCTSAGKVCSNGSCTTVCTPSCAGKCAGESDDCGGTCATNSCAGCCSGTACVFPTTDASCGYSGVACQDCTSSGEICSNGNCVSTCSPDCTEKCAGESDGCGGTCAANTCSGCCSSGTCKPGTQDLYCGTGGGSCTSCGYGQTCSGGSCKCGPASCATCCDNNSCVYSVSDQRCGSGGGTCKSCPSYATCNGGTCVVNDSAKFDVVAVSASIKSPTSDPAGTDWDGEPDKPDPFLAIDWGGCTWCDANSGYIADTYFPSWNATIATGVTAGTLKGSWCVFLRDKDNIAGCTCLTLAFCGSDVIAQCTPTITDADLISGRKIISNCPGTDGVGHIYSIVIDFNPVP